MASVAAGGRAAVRRTTSSLLVATTKHSMKGQDSSMPHSTSVSLMYRAGLICQASSGVYHWLPLGFRTMEKLIKVIDREMGRIGGAKILLPSLLTQDLWKQSGRLEEMGMELFKLSDRSSKPYCLAPTHEEPVTDLVASKVSSHRQLPLRLYQVSVKFRDEERPRYGLLRCKEFWMKDMYSFDVDKQAAMESYHLVQEAYGRIFQQLEQPIVEVQASSGMIGGDLSHEYHVTAPIGEDTVITCPRCDFAINKEMKEEKMDGRALCPQGQQWSSCHLEESKSIEVGHTFYLGTKYSKLLKSKFMDEKSNEHEKKMAVEKELGTTNDSLNDKARDLYDYLSSSRLQDEVVLEDRYYLTPGRRFKDAESIGYPKVAIVGKNTSEQDRVEVESCTRKGRIKEIMTFEEFRDTLLHDKDQFHLLM